MHPVTRDPASHKGDNCRILIIGGSKDYVGAVTLAGVACLRSGADWVTIAAPEKVAWAINKLSPDLITKKLKGDFLSALHLKELKLLMARHDTVLIGNGMGLNPATRKLIKKIINHCVKNKKYLVIDADALTIISIQEVENAILTPHRKEFESLLRNSRLDSVRSLKKVLRNNI